MIDAPGKYKISFEDYLADPCHVPSLSRSTIKDLLFRSPRHAFENHPKLNPNFQPEESEKKFDIGTAAHSVLLEGIDKVYVCPFDDWRTKTSKDFRDAARVDGKIPLLSKQADDVLAMVESGIKQLRASELNLDLSTGRSELTYVWQEGQTWLKIRPDWIRPGLIIDYKSTSILARPEEYARLAISTGLDIQDALYCRGVEEIDGECPRFIFAVQEITSPYLMALFEFDQTTKHVGEEKIDRAKTIWDKCMITGEWSGYPRTIQPISIPAWGLAAWEMKRFGIDIENQGEL